MRRILLFAGGKGDGRVESKKGWARCAEGAWHARERRERIMEGGKSPGGSGRIGAEAVPGEEIGFCRDGGAVTGERP